MIVAFKYKKLYCLLQSSPLTKQHIYRISTEQPANPIAAVLSGTFARPRLQVLFPASSLTDLASAVNQTYKLRFAKWPHGDGPSASSCVEGIKPDVVDGNHFADQLQGAAKQSQISFTLPAEVADFVNDLVLGATAAGSTDALPAQQLIITSNDSDVTVPLWSVQTGGSNFLNWSIFFSIVCYLFISTFSTHTHRFCCQRAVGLLHQRAALCVIGHCRPRRIV